MGKSILKVLLIPNPTPEYGSPVVHLPVGLLCVAAVLSDGGVNVRILDINSEASAADYDEIPGAIAAEKPDIVGFSTMGNHYATIIRLARRCRELKPDMKIIFGGPQATFTDQATLEAFPHVDLIVRGECEQTILPVVKALCGDNDLHSIPGITFRDQTGIVRNPPAPLIRDLDSLPDPRYDLFPSMHLVKNISVEEGRGCPYDCSFCCTNQFWQRNFRLRSVDRIVGLIKKLISHYNIREFSLTHDIFALSPDRVLRFCEAIKKENLNIRWHCSCRIDRLDDDLLEQMAETGCTCLYFGIETGSERMQKSIGKNLDLSRVIETANRTAGRDMHYTASFIMGFPDEKPDDLKQTIDLMMKLKYMKGKVQVVQYHMLNALPASRLYQQYGKTLRFDGNFPGSENCYLGKEDVDMVQKNPQVFTAYHYFPSKYLERALIVRLHFVVGNLFRYMPCTTFVFYRDKSLEFPGCVMKNYQSLDLPGDSGIGKYERLVRIGKFLDVILVRYLGREEHPIREVMRYELAVLEIKECNNDEASTGVKEFSFDIEKFIKKIETSGFKRLPRAPRRERVILMFVKKDGKIVTARLPDKLAGHSCTNPETVECV
ncbi:MAG: B12-binding domain-containing radical SAM protein [Candidatus Aminicenantes bacterium]|nr:MAG: B12-binding domain-containing radical SAM protein [Candidatus Aminicenantes bacterium]